MDQERCVDGDFTAYYDAQRVKRSNRLFNANLGPDDTAPLKVLRLLRGAAPEDLLVVQYMRDYEKLRLLKVGEQLNAHISLNR